MNALELKKEQEINELNNLRNQLKKEGYKYHHTAMKRGYIRRGESRAAEYHGRFGDGYIIKVANNLEGRSSLYYVVEYYIA